MGHALKEDGNEAGQCEADGGDKSTQPSGGHRFEHYLNSASYYLLMPIVTENTVRYLVRSIIDGKVEEFSASHFGHMPKLHPSFAALKPHYFRNLCQYRQPDGSLKGRSKKTRSHIEVERVGFIQIPGRPCRRRRRLPEADAGR